MTGAPNSERPQCRAARETIQLRLDESVGPKRLAELAEHLRNCAPCRSREAELRALRGALRAMPKFRLPAEVRWQVESATVERSRLLERWSGGLPRRWRGVAAAAALAVAVAGTWWMSSSPEQTPSQAEVAQAARQLELVLGLTGAALATVEQVTFQDVLGKHVLPAVEHIPLRWPSTTLEAGEAETSPDNGSA